MHTHAYAIWDRVGQDIHQGVIIMHPSDASAIRLFADVVLAPNSPLARHADDYALIHLGSLDTQAGYDDQTQQPIPVLYLDDNATRVVITARAILTAQRDTPNA